MATVEGSGEKKDEDTTELGPILRAAKRLPEGKVKRGVAKAAVTAELVKGALTVEPPEEPEPEVREIEEDPRLGLVERRRAEDTAREEMITRLGDMPLGAGPPVHEQVIHIEPAEEALMRLHLSGRQLSRNPAPIPSLPNYPDQHDPPPPGGPVGPISSA